MLKRELEKICFHCNYFFMEAGVENLGVCMRDEAFSPFEEEIYENCSFANCNDLYMEKRYDGNREACSHYDEAEIIELSDDDEQEEGELNADELIAGLKNQNVDGMLAELYDSDRSRLNRIVEALHTFICFDNEGAYQGLLHYYNQLPAAEELDDVHTRVRIVDVLMRRKDTDTLLALVNELKRSPSNNVTRQLYTKILEELRRFPLELRSDPIQRLLSEKKFRPKIKKRIEELLEPEPERWWADLDI